MATRNIYIGGCDTGGDGGGDIVVCHEKTDPEGREITVCVDCTNPPELTLTGEDEPSVGDAYAVTGGVSPFIWSFSGGTIDNTGTITAITSCGGTEGNGAVGAVTVTDACGQSANITVRLPGGAWGAYIDDYSDLNCGGTYESGEVIKKIVGSVKTTYIYCRVALSSPYGFSCSSPSLVGRPCCTYCSVNDLDSSGSVADQKGVYLSYQYHQNWEC